MIARQRSEPSIVEINDRINRSALALQGYLTASPSQESYPKPPRQLCGKQIWLIYSSINLPLYLDKMLVD